MATPTNYISQAKVGTTTYDIYALGLNNGGTFYSTQELLNLVSGAGFVPAVTSSLPAANATTYETYKNTITFVGETSADGKNNVYDEYVIIKDGNNYSWEVVGHTGVQIEGLKTIANATGAPSTDATGSAGSATINGSNFSFTGTTATITVPAHTHSMGGTKKYLTKSNVPATFSSTSVITGLDTTTVVSAGSATTVLTGYTNPTKTEVATGVSGTIKRYKTASVVGTAGTVTVAKAGTAMTVVTGAINGYASPTKAGMATTSIYPAADVNAVTSVNGTTALVYPAADVTALTSVTSSSTNIYPAANITPVTSITYATISVSNGVLEFPQTAYGYTSSTASARDTSVSVINSVTVAAGKSVRGTGTTVVISVSGETASVRGSSVTVATGSTTTGTQFLTGLGNATAATTASITPVSGTEDVAKASTSAVTVVTNGVTTTGGVAVLTDVSASGTTDAIVALGTASTESVAKAGSEISVVTGASGTTNAYTGVATNASAFTGVSTSSSTGSQEFISAVNANTGEKAAVDISYQPAGSIGGSQSISAHTHSLSAHTHSIPALSITVPTT